MSSPQHARVVRPGAPRDGDATLGPADAQEPLPPDGTAGPRGRSRWDVPARWPVVAPLVLLAVALVLRIIDVYVLRLDEVLGEIILSKSLGLALVVGYLWWIGRRLSDVGLHARRL